MGNTKLPAEDGLPAPGPYGQDWNREAPFSPAPVKEASVIDHSYSITLTDFESGTGPNMSCPSASKTEEDSSIPAKKTTAHSNKM